MFNKLINKSKSDRGDTLVMFVISIPFIMILMGFSININQSVNSSIEYNAIAQTSVENAVKKVDSQGSLNNNSIQKFVNEYRIQSGDSSEPSRGTNETKAFQSSVCNTAEVEGVERKMPYMIVTLGTERGTDKVQSQSSWTIEGVGSDAVEQKPLGSEKYKVISATVYNTSTSLWGAVGLSDCQLHKSQVSAISFGSNTDLR